ncbi:carboxymuconolactone decarboxylase family protein [Pseudomonadales bacterium]|jgi:alkylhydroperoxidase family enzyme|nr:carboxymuconolactone decarboxylase family protein [Pseudomonadales bacterium]
MIALADNIFYSAMEDQLTRGREIMRLEKPRIQPLTLENCNEDQAKMLKQQQIRGKPANIFLTMANHEKLAKRWLVFGNHILSKSTLDPREREIAILRIGWLCQAGYEWGQHVVIGKAAGMSEEDIDNIKIGADAGWSKHEALIIKAVDELHSDAFVSDETWVGLKETYSDQQMMDLVFTVGQYNMVSMALNSFGVQLDDYIEGF